MRIVGIFIFLLCICFIVCMSPLSKAAAAQIDEPAWVYKGRGDTYFRKGDAGHAIYEYKKALIRAGKEGRVYPEVNLQLAKIYRDEGLYEFALSQIEIVQRNAELLQIPDLIYEARYTMADVFILLERYNDALTVYEQIIREDENKKGYDMVSIYDIWADPDEEPLKRMRFAEAYLRIGIIKYISGNFENSIPALKMALLYRHEIDETLGYLMSCYERIGDARAYEFLKKIIETRNKTVRVKKETA
jgi:tetratricopeptide (TPR) repeat protein